MAVSVYMVDTTRPLKREVAVGRIIGDTANANGKIFAAFKSEDERADLLAMPRTRLTPSTITEPDALERELLAVRREGIAYDNEESNTGTCAVAAPVRDQLGKVIAAVSMVVPTGRFRSPGEGAFRRGGQGDGGGAFRLLGVFQSQRMSSDGLGVEQRCGHGCMKA